MAQENNESLWQLIPQKSIRGPRGPIHNTVQRQVLTQLRLVLTPPEFLLVSYCGAKVGRLTRKFVKNHFIYGSCSIREKYFIYAYSIMFTDIT